jgi:OHCU decarboxylase
VAVLTADTRVGSAGSSSASRQTYVTGGAVKAACEAIRERLGADPRTMTGDELAELLGEDAVEETVEWRHRETFPLDENGQGDAHVQFAFSAHRAVVDVDVELGLVRVVELATAQEVGKAINPQALEGQIQGGTAQGLGLALFEEIQMKDGRVLNASFTDYLLPTILDMPPMRIDILEHPDPEAPYGLKGVGEPPHISTPPAVVAALRAASGRPLTRIPVRPEHIVGLVPTGLSVSLADLGGLFEHSPWVAETAWQRRPFGSVAELHAALERAMREAPRERQLELIRAHPELAGREAHERTLTRESTEEQASAGLDRLTADELDALRRLNRAYRERFGFPLIVCVREHTKTSIIASGNARLEHSPEQEVEVALGEIAKIARLRLADLLEEAS